MGNDTHQRDENFYGAMGRFVLSWGHLDLGLECFVEILYYGYDGKSIEAEVPRALKRKLAFLRAAVKTLPIGDDAIQGYLGFFDRIQTAAETRHNIIHGAVIEQSESREEAVMVRIIRGKSEPVRSENRFTTTSILAAAVEVQQLSRMLKKSIGGSDFH